jgi:uracil-DNA glycosylase
MAESQEENVVYLEDIETQSRTQSEPTQSQGDGSLSTTSLSQKATSSTVAVGNKRQRTLMDMFSGSQPDKASVPASKKLKVSASEPTSLATRTLASGSKNLRLNAIPFSLAQFQESLSTDQRSLLALECAYMGKSWCVVVIRSHALVH